MFVWRSVGHRVFKAWTKQRSTSSIIRSGQIFHTSVSINVFTLNRVSDVKDIKRVSLAQGQEKTSFSTPQISSGSYARLGQSLANMSIFPEGADPSGLHAVSLESGPYRYRRCSQCDYGTYNSSNMARHLRAHAGYRPYACHLCQYRTAQNAHLKRHLASHRRKGEGAAPDGATPVQIHETARIDHAGVASNNSSSSGEIVKKQPVTED